MSKTVADTAKVTISD